MLFYISEDEPDKFAPAFPVLSRPVFLGDAQSKEQ